MVQSELSALGAQHILPPPTGTLPVAGTGRSFAEKQGVQEASHLVTCCETKLGEKKKRLWHISITILQLEAVCINTQRYSMSVGKSVFNEMNSLPLLP